MKHHYKLAFLLAAFTASASQAGITTYEVDSYADAKGAHALWTNKDFRDNKFKASSLLLTVDDRGTASVADDTARLHGVVNSSRQTAVVDLMFSGAMQALDKKNYRYKKENGLRYNDLFKNNNSPLFWSDISGSIRVDQDVYDVDRHVLNNGKLFTFQMGYGANAKSKTDFGGSSWVQTCKNGVTAGMKCMDSHHWDLNLKLTKKESDVPEPSVFALMALGAAGLFASRRMMKKA